MPVLNQERAKSCKFHVEDCEYVSSPFLCWCDPADMLIGGKNPTEYCPEITKYLYEAAGCK